MRNFQQLCVAVVLMLALSTCGFAGIIGTTPEAPTPPTNNLAVTIVLTLVQVVVP